MKLIKISSHFYSHKNKSNIVIFNVILKIQVEMMKLNVLKQLQATGTNILLTKTTTLMKTDLSDQNRIWEMKMFKGILSKKVSFSI